MKLVKLGCEGYKPFRGPEEISLRPLTILFGKNNSGKTAMLRLCRLLLRSLSTRAGAEFPLEVDDLSYGELFRDLIHQGSIHGQVSFSIELEENQKLLQLAAKVQNLVDVHSGRDDQVVSQLKLCEPDILLDWARTREKPAQYLGYGVVLFRELWPETGNGLPLCQNFIENWREAIRKFEDAVSHLGAQRRGIAPIYQKGVTPQLGFDGAGATSLLAERSELLEAVADWYELHMDGWRLSLDSAGKGFRCVLQRGTVTINLADAGLGMQQVLPVIVQQLAHRWDNQSNFLDLIEEPELHLHPAAHAPLADLFLESALNGRGQVLVETHSENLILRVRRRIAECAYGLAPENVALYWIEDLEDGASTVRQIQIHRDGSVDFWPEGIFSEGYQEVRALRRAARSHEGEQA